MKTLSLEVCKKIAELNVKYETEKWWVKAMYITDSVYCLEDWKGQYADDLVKEDTYFPAYSFSEILDILLQIGERLGLAEMGDPHCLTVQCLICTLTATDKIAHRLTDAYLTGGMEAVDQELKTLLANK